MINLKKKKANSGRKILSLKLLTPKSERKLGMNMKGLILPWGSNQ